MCQIMPMHFSCCSLGVFKECIHYNVSLRFFFFQNKKINGKSVAEKYYAMGDMKQKEYMQYHADTLQSIAKQYVPFVELGDELSKF